MGVSGSAGVSVLNITTRSFIGDDTPTDSTSLTSGVADVVAEGNVIVTANDETHITEIAGAVGVGSVGVGASAAVTVVNKTTEAYLGRNAEVTGKGNDATNVEYRALRRCNIRCVFRQPGIRGLERRRQVSQESHRACGARHERRCEHVGRNVQRHAQ